MFCDPVNLTGHFRVFRFEVKPALFIEPNRSIVDIFEDLQFVEAIRRVDRVSQA
jgi:hypothetical protein